MNSPPDEFTAEEFEIPKRLLKIFKEKEKLLKHFRAGKIPQEIWGYSDDVMEKFYQVSHKLLKNNRFEEAAEAFVFLATLKPKNPQYWLGLGVSLQYCHEYEAAINAYEMAAILEIENPWPYLYLAKCLFAIHDRESALQALDLAIEYAGEKEEYADLKNEALKAKDTLLK